MNYAIVLAGGTGTRMGAGIPKQFIEVNGKPVIAYTIEKFENCGGIDGILVVCKNEWVFHAKEITEKYNFTKVFDVISGGEDRRASSAIGVRRVESYITEKHDGETPGNTVVLIHDAARPFVTERIIEENIALAAKYGACETAVKINDTVARAEGGALKGIDSIVPRENLYRVQTPQSFLLSVILEAHSKTPSDAKITDDAMLVLSSGGTVRIAEGDSGNIKITTPDDLKFFNA